MDKSKLWSGRFDGETSNLTEAFTASQHFDRRLAKYDVAGTMAPVSYTHLTLPTSDLV